MPRSVAVNIGANTNEPGFRAPVYADGSFDYVPIPETKATTGDVPTYRDLDFSFDVPESVADTPVHLDPTFAGCHDCSEYTYGDPHGVKARPLLDLERGDRVYFYATLDRRDDAPADWGAYLIGHFVLACDPIPGDDFDALSDDRRLRLSGNAHRRRDPFDATVLLLGEQDGSRQYETAVPLSSRERGIDANHIVTELSADSGKGPWWRRPLRFDQDGASSLALIAAGDDFDKND